MDMPAKLFAFGGRDDSLKRIQAKTSAGMEDIKLYLKRNRMMVAFAGLLVFGSGCAGAVKTTGDDLAEDALAPVAVPVREGNEALGDLERVQAEQEARARQAEDASQ